MAEEKKETGVTLDNVIESFRKLQDQVLNHPEEVTFLTEGKVGNPITIGPRVLPAEEWSKKQVDNASRASAEWLAHVITPKKDPVEAAIRANGKRKDRLEQAEREGRWLKAMGAVNKDLMYEVIKTMGEAAFRTGVEGRRKKVEAVVKDLQPRIAAVAATIDAMPDATDADREKRLIAARRLMIEVGKSRRGT